MSSDLQYPSRPPAPQPVTARQPVQPNPPAQPNSDFGQAFLRGAGQLIGGALQGFSTGGPVGAVIGGVGALISGGKSSGNPEFDAQMAQYRAEARQNMLMQMEMNAFSQSVTARTNMMQSRHEAAMAVVRNFKA